MRILLKAEILSLKLFSLSLLFLLVSSMRLIISQSMLSLLLFLLMLSLFCWFWLLDFSIWKQYLVLSKIYKRRRRKSKKKEKSRTNWSLRSQSLAEITQTMGCSRQQNDKNEDKAHSNHLWRVETIQTSFSLQ